MMIIKTVKLTSVNRYVSISIRKKIYILNLDHPVILVLKHLYIYKYKCYIYIVLYIYIYTHHFISS